MNLEKLSWIFAIAAGSVYLFGEGVKGWPYFKRFLSTNIGLGITLYTLQMLFRLYLADWDFERVANAAVISGIP